MPIIPIAINNGTHPTGNYSHSWGKFSYGYPEKAQFATQPGGLTWVSSLDATAFSGYFIISDTVTEDGALSNPRPTFHVTGYTDQEILYLIRRIKSIREVNTNFLSAIDAKKFVIEVAGLNHYDADLSNYLYWNQGSLKLNFDFGNLNCDVKEAVGTVAYNLVVPPDAAIIETLQGFGNNSITSINANRATSYRRFLTGNTYYGLQSGTLSTLNTTVGDSFLFALRMKPTFPTSGTLTVFETVGNATFEMDQSILGYRFSIGASSVTIPFGSNNTWTTIVFGKDPSGNLFINDGTNSNSISSAASQMVFDVGATNLGNIGSINGSVDIASFQYWKGNDDELDSNAISFVQTEQKLNRWN